MPHTPRSYAKCVSSLIDGESDSQKKEMLKKGDTPRRSKGSKARVNLRKAFDAEQIIKENVLAMSQHPSDAYRAFLKDLARVSGRYWGTVGIS